MASQFGYQVDEATLIANPRTAADYRCARLCAVLIEHLTTVADTELRYAIGRDPDLLDGTVADTATAVEYAWRSIAVLLRAAVAAGAVRQLTLTGLDPVDDTSWRPSVVRIAGNHGGPYPCQVSRRTWNGWVRPRFTRDVAARIIDDLNYERQRADARPSTLPGQMLNDGSVLLIHDDGTREVFHSGVDDMFAIGAGTWMWEEWLA